MVERRSDTIPAQRRAILVEHVRARGAASIAVLADVAGTSPSTVRRDLEMLEKQGHLVRTHGGAAVPGLEGSVFEPDAEVAEQLAAAEKAAIGAAAAAMIVPGASVIFDSGSTVREAARAVAARRIALTAVTNDLGIGQILAAVDTVRVLVPGGAVRPGSLTLLGEPGLGFYGGIHADIAFVGAHAVADGWMSDTSLEVAAAKRAMVGAARRTVLLVDGSKFRPPAFCRIAPLSVADTVITDPSATRAALDALREAGVAVTVAEVAGA